MFNVTSSILSKSGLTADQINELLNGRGDFESLGQAIIEVETEYGINAFWLMAQMTQEVGWSGHSAIADDKHNLFGVDAYDGAPEADASVFASFAACVENQGVFLSGSYLKPGDKYYVSPTPAGVAQHYASDKNYAYEVTNIMNIYYGNSLSLAHTPVAPAPVADSNLYTVQGGDNLSIIAAHFGVTLAAIEAANTNAGHPAGDFNDIWPGDTIVIPNPVAPQPVQAEVYIAVPPAPAGDLSVLAAKYGSSVSDIVSWNQAKYPSMTADNVDAGWYIRVK